MTPFIIWLDKRDLDNIITMLVKLDGSTMKNNMVFNDDELVKFSEDLIEQNADLLQLLKKIDLSALIDELTLKQVRYYQKCKTYQKQLKKIIAHCDSYSSNSKSPIGNLKLPNCNNCYLRDINKDRNN